LQQYIPKHLDTVLEIGAGTGMYLERVIDLCSPRTYEVYETNIGWVKYLEAQYSQRTHLRCHNADGTTLRNTKAGSVDAVFAHGVFVYVPLLVSFGYLEEAVRVLTPGGILVFDCFVAEHFGIAIIRQWQNDPYKWTFHVLMSQSLLTNLRLDIDSPLLPLLIYATMPPSPLISFFANSSRFQINTTLPSERWDLRQRPAESRFADAGQVRERLGWNRR
jgi:SAM-dependent methyltransferase